MPSKSKHEPKGASRSRDQAKREETVEEEYDLVNDGPKKEDVNAAVLRGWPPNRSEFFENRGHFLALWNARTGGKYSCSYDNQNKEHFVVRDARKGSNYGKIVYQKRLPDNEDNNAEILGEAYQELEALFSQKWVSLRDERTCMQEIKKREADYFAKYGNR